MKQRIITGLVALAIGVPSYLGVKTRNASLEKDWVLHNQRLRGTVIAESYDNTLSANPAHNGLVSYSNETVKLDSKYTVTVKLENGKTVGLSVIDATPYGTQTKEALDAIINVGDTIDFRAGTMRADNFFIGSSHNYDRKETWFGDKTQIGVKRASSIYKVE